MNQLISLVGSQLLTSSIGAGSPSILTCSGVSYISAGWNEQSTKDDNHSLLPEEDGWLCIAVGRPDMDQHFRMAQTSKRLPLFVWSPLTMLMVLIVLLTFTICWTLGIARAIDLEGL
jgi:hypothetical protein